MRAHAIGMATLLAIVAPACGEKKAENEGPRAKKVSTTAAGSTGSLTGKIAFDGAAPEMPELPRYTETGKPKDAACDTHEKAEYVVVNGGGVKDVVVRLAVGAVARPAASETPPPLVIDQKNCRYSPHVAVAITGQKIAFRNDDDTMHNVHTYRGTETDFNIAQPKGTPEQVKDVTVPAGDVPYKIGCDVHPWMQAFVLVTDHPYVTVTGADGTFKLDNLPYGSYKLEAWHPYLGQKTIDVTVEPGKAVEVKLPAFGPADYKAPG